MSSLVNITTEWTCEACHAHASNEQTVSVLEMSLRRDKLLVRAPEGWQTTATHAFCPVHGDPLPHAAEMLALPRTVEEMQFDQHHAAVMRRVA